MDETEPRVLGKYILGERLAAGGMAEVFHARPVVGRFDGPIVLKRMLPALASRPDFVTMFVEEARISTHLDHPNIVRVYDFDASDHGLFLVMELVDGPDLLAIVSRCAKLKRKLNPELAAYIACHTLEALDYAHHAVSPRGQSLRIVHRDVSPSNILITRRGHVKLADFGIARASSLGRTQEIAKGTLKGKFGYMSPEQIRGEEPDARSDVFSMGVVLAEMLMAKRLFSTPNRVELLRMVREGDLSRLDAYGADIPRSLDAIVRKALAVDLEVRYRSADALREALVDWLASSTRRTGAPRLAELICDLERESGPLCAGIGTSAKSGSVSISGTQASASDASAPSESDEVTVKTDPPAMNEAPAGTARPTWNAPRAPERPDRGSTRPPSQIGALAPGVVVDLLCVIARDQRTGALLMRGGELFKEAYFCNGDPVFVHCNVPEDSFGELLVQRGVLSRAQLDRVLASLDQFNGRMEQALVSLDLLRPVDVVQLLAAQVAAKLVSACDWQTGSYEYRDGELNPWPTLAFELKTHAILGKVLGNIPLEKLAAWSARVADQRATLHQEHLRAFELEPRALDRLRPLADGGRTMRDVLASISSRDERAQVAAIAYVLWRCHVLRLDAAS